jgi:hypothetical protein
MNWTDLAALVILVWFFLKTVSFYRNKDQHFVEALFVANSQPVLIKRITATYCVPNKGSNPHQPHESFKLDYSAGQIKYCAKWRSPEAEPDFIDVLIFSERGALRLRLDGDRLLYARNKTRLKRVRAMDHDTVEQIVSIVEARIQEDGHEFRPPLYLVKSMRRA